MPDDGEAVCCDGDGLASFTLLRSRRHDGRVFLYAFDLIELDGKDLRSAPVEARKAALAKLLRRAKPGLKLNEHLAEPGDVVFAHALQDGAGGDCLEAAGIALPIGPLAPLAQVQEP
jgi:bifunctional non-homologous end joining protein LigD